MLSKNEHTLNDFIDYCYEHREERFWQALRNWSETSGILAINKFGFEPKDTFHWEGKNG